MFLCVSINFALLGVLILQMRSVRSNGYDVKGVSLALLTTEHNNFKQRILIVSCGITVDQMCYI